MKRTDALNHIGNQFNDGNPATGVKGTRVDASWLNNVQEELAAVIEDAGITLSGGDTNQLLDALGRYARKDTSNVFNGRQSFNYTGTYGIEVVGGGTGANFIADFTTTHASGANYIRQTAVGNNNKVFAQMGNAGGRTDFSVLSNDTGVVFTNTGGTFYDCNSSRTHRFYGAGTAGAGAAQFYFSLGDSSSTIALEVSNSNNYAAIVTPEPTLLMGSATDFIVRTGGASRLQIAGAQHYSDGADYSGTLYKAFSVRAWCVYTDTNNTAGSGGTLRAQGNVSSVTDNGAGNYTINFTSPLPDLNYAASGVASQTSSSPSVDTGSEWTTTNTATLIMNIITYTPTYCIAVFDSDDDSRVSPARFTFSAVR